MQANDQCDTVSSSALGRDESLESPCTTELVVARERAGLSAGVSHHLVLLILSVVVVGMSLLLGVQGERRVVIPYVNVSLPALCTWQRLMDRPCPGCGLTRCFISMAHGDVAGAWHFHPLGVFLFGLLLVQVPYRGVQLWRLTRGRDQFRLGTMTWLVWGAILALFAQWLTRMIW